MRQLFVPAAVLVVVVAAGAWRFWPRKAPVGPSGRPTLAVLNFENLSGDAALDAWRAGVPELLTTNLSQSRLLSVVSSEAIVGILKQLNLAGAARYSADDLARASG